MANIKKLVLDILKPHQPNALEFASRLAELGVSYKVNLTVAEMDEKTETTVVVIEGNNLDYEEIQAAVQEMGGSIHSIDEVEVQGTGEA